MDLLYLQTALVLPNNVCSNTMAYIFVYFTAEQC